MRLGITLIIAGLLLFWSAYDLRDWLEHQHPLLVFGLLDGLLTGAGTVLVIQHRIFRSIPKRIVNAPSFQFGFVGCVALFVAMNLASFHFETSGGIALWLGTARIADGIYACGYPFIVYEQGGIDGRNRFNPWALMANVAVTYFLAVEVGLAKRRFHRIIAIREHLCPECGYDLQGSLVAGRTRCPECDEPIAGK